MSTVNIIHAYRHIYRHILRAVQFSSPSRYIARDQLRAAFRDGASSPDAESIKRTIWFFQAAAKEKGLEHKILKNLVRVQGEKIRKEGGHWKKVLAISRRRQGKGDWRDEEMAFAHYERTVRMLNESMGICLR